MEHSSSHILSYCYHVILYLVTGNHMIIIVLCDCNTLSIVALITGVLILVLVIYHKYAIGIRIRRDLSEVYKLGQSTQRTVRETLRITSGLLGQQPERQRRHRSRPTVFNISQRIESQGHIPQIPAPVYSTQPRSQEQIIIPSVTRQSDSYQY